jgi:NAD(P)-dependent dehydrogenase (short-subunit alcohol dehydrogenase family)
MLAPHVAILGVGGIGLAIARRLDAGRRLLVADISPKSLEHAANNLTADGHYVETHTVNVTNYAAVQDFARAAAHGSKLSTVIHTAGVATDQASTQQILDVDILGTANVISAFQAHATVQMSMVCFASVASYFAGDVSPELERHLALAPLDSLLGHEELNLYAENAYPIAKRANVLRVQGAARAWALKGARIKSVSPGAVMTAMGRAALAGPQAEYYRRQIKGAPMGRSGSTDEVASMMTFLVGSESSFVTGADFVVDGGLVTGSKWAL